MAAVAQNTVWKIINTPIGSPVSYTHLDVYKRQVYPGGLITETGPPELFEAARRSLERRLLHAKRQGGWPGSWKISLMARFKNPLECGHTRKSTG